MSARGDDGGPRLLVVTRNFPPATGGIETLVHEFVSHAPEQLKSRTLLVHIGQRRAGKEDIGTVAYRHFPGAGRLAAMLASLLFLPILYFRHRPARIVHMQYTTALPSLLLGRMLRAPYLVFAYGLEMKPSRKRIHDAVKGFVLRGAQRVIAISRYTDGLVAHWRVPPSRRVIVHPGAHVRNPVPGKREARDALPGVPKDAFVLLTVCRLVPRKGIDVVLEALSDLDHPHGGGIVYLIGGGGPDRTRLERIARERGLGDRVRFLGRVADGDLERIYAAADVFILPSRESRQPPDVEGFGIVFVEAAACGTPAIGSNSGGIPDAVVDGETGFLVEPGDAVALRERIVRLMRDPDLLRMMGENARRRVESELNWEAFCAKAYEVILARAG